MSGVEVAGLFLGVLPVVIEAVKAYHATCEKIQIFQHYSREVERIQKQFRVRQRMFLNECHLLLQLVVDDDVTKAMLGDFEHSLWRDKDLNNQLNNYLSDSYQSCKDIVEDTQTILEDVGEELRCFDVIASEKLKVKLDDPFQRYLDLTEVTIPSSRVNHLNAPYADLEIPSLSHSKRRAMKLAWRACVTAMLISTIFGRRLESSSGSGSSRNPA